MQFHGSGPVVIPDEWLADFFPARSYLYEWETYWLQCPGADRIEVGGLSVGPAAADFFPIRLENRLGLTTLQPFAGDRPLAPALPLEVLSPKFPSLEDHRRFLGALLDELFSSAARLPFAFHAPTARGVIPSISPPTPLFTFHYLLNHGEELRAALAVIQDRPHRDLCSRSDLINLNQASSLDADTILELFHRPEEWQPGAGSPLADRLGGHLPARVLQRRPEETRDTPENRFTAAFLRELHLAAMALPEQSWWGRAPAVRRAAILATAAMIQDLLHSPLFSGVGPAQGVPDSSLLLRPGYRELLGLWLSFQGARQPLFGRLSHAAALRDIATLYEMWVFFRLVEEIGATLGLPLEDGGSGLVPSKDLRPGLGPSTDAGLDLRLSDDTGLDLRLSDDTGLDLRLSDDTGLDLRLSNDTGLDLRLSDDAGLGTRAEARFGGGRTLIYNRTYPAGEEGGSYSVPLRPDFTWSVNEKPEVALDAKFRLNHPSAEGSEDPGPGATFRGSDLFKMHTYRDALGVRAAVALYPGDLSLFYHRQAPPTAIRIPALLLGSATGVGAIALQPNDHPVLNPVNPVNPVQNSSSIPLQPPNPQTQSSRQD